MKLLKLAGVLMLALSMMYCSKSEEKVTLQYYQTKCADQWSSNQNSTNDEIIASIKTFFETEYQINLENLSINNGTVGQDCEACDCLTGRVITAIVDEQFIDELTAEGFFIL